MDFAGIFKLGPFKTCYVKSQGKKREVMSGEEYRAMKINSLMVIGEAVISHNHTVINGHCVIGAAPHYICQKRYCAAVLSI
jgi:hypothetical protein